MSEEKDQFSSWIYATGKFDGINMLYLNPKDKWEETGYLNDECFPVELQNALVGRNIFESADGMCEHELTDESLESLMEYWGIEKNEDFQKFMNQMDDGEPELEDWEKE